MLHWLGMVVLYFGYFLLGLLVYLFGLVLLSATVRVLVHHASRAYFDCAYEYHVRMLNIDVPETTPDSKKRKSVFSKLVN